MSSMSTAPRPQSIPSAISPANGSYVHSLGSAGTTSRWPWMSSAGRLRSSPSTRVDDAGAVALRLEDLRLEPDLGEQAGDVLRRLPLALAAAGAVVDALEADEVAAELDDLLLRVHLGHAALPSSTRLPDRSPPWSSLQSSASGARRRVHSSEWRNGRRAALRSLCPKGRGGSTPPSDTRTGTPVPQGPGFLAFGLPRERHRAAVPGRVDRAHAEEDVVLADVERHRRDVADRRRRTSQVGLVVSR